MLTIRPRFRTFGLVLIVLMLMLAASFILILSMVDLDAYKEQILTELRSSLNRPVTYKTGSVSFSFGPAFSFDSVVIKEPDGSAEFVAIESLTCRIELLPLIRKQLVVHGIIAKNPVIRLERRKDGTFNITDLLQTDSSKGPPLKIHDIKFRNGDITFIDRVPQPEPLITRLTQIDMALDNLGRAKKTGINLSATLGGSTSGTIAFHGKLRLSPDGIPLDQSTLDAKVATKKLDLAPLWPYYQQHVPFKKVLGALDMDSEFHGKTDGFSTTGRISINSLSFDYQPVFKSPLTPGSLKVKYSLELNKSDINIKAVEINLDGTTVNGSCAIKEYRSADPRIIAQAVTSAFDLSKFKQYIPYGIIVTHVSKWIEEHIKGGIYHLEDGRLDGRVSQILHMEKGENYNVLYIKARVEKGVVSYGSAVPTFNNIKGLLEMKGKDFFLHNMSGNFGAAPLTLEGRITDYPLDKPSGYPFKMTISPGRNEIAWLLGKERADKFTYNGSSSLTLTGEGYTTDYRLAGEWNLTPVAYSYSDLVSKPVGTSSSINFKGALSPTEALLTSMHYTLGGLSLDVSAKYQFTTVSSLDLLINTNSFTIESIATMSPAIRRYQPSGKVHLAVRCSTPDIAKEDMRWKGIVDFKNAALHFEAIEKPLSAITGVITFGENAMETSQLSARVGSTVFSGRGSISSLSPVAFSTSFSTPRIDLTDFGLVMPKKMPQLTKVLGEISFSDNNLIIKSLSGTINSSQLNVKGAITDLHNPKADLAVYSSYLDIDDIVLLGGISRKVSQVSQMTAAPSLKATIKADKGNYSGTNFKKLNAAIILEKRIIQIQPLEALILGGKLNAKVVIAADSLPARYQADFKLADAAASEIINLVSVDKRELTGTMTIEGELAARGDTPAALKKTVAGAIKIHARNGTIRQFPFLSKVFSILNVSQLFKLTLPDMVSEGMPYNDIKATMAFKDGTVSTDDLFITSNAMNMSLVGKNDFINDNMDFTLGIQPLQTVDKVVSHIPIVGWILTGKEKALITAYFEVKGKANAPQVSAIPVKALGKGILGIFKRVFQLPVKLITDTGEVILGN